MKQAMAYEYEYIVEIAKKAMEVGESSESKIKSISKQLSKALPSHDILLARWLLKMLELHMAVYVLIQQREYHIRLATLA